jgi:ferredoxin-type protein NapF
VSKKLREQANGQPADGQPDFGRRGLLTGSFLTREGRESTRRQEQRRQKPLGPRTPWFQQVMEAGSDSCSRCEQECANSCPQHIIRLHPDGHAFAGSPWLDFSVTGCTFCGDCAKVCPSLESYEKESLQTGNLQLIKTKCLTWNNVFCMSCTGKCDVRALRLDDRRRLILNDSLCTGCGMCVHSCPVNALDV